MRRTVTILTVLAISFALAGCANTGNEQTGVMAIGSGAGVVAIDTGDLSSGVAAEVGDVEIGENAITAYLNNFRYSQGLQDDDDWGQWIFDAGYSIEGLRSDTVEYFVSQELVRQAAAQEGINVTDAEIDEAIADARGDSTEEEYASALDQQGVDEATYRDNVYIGLLQKKLKEKVGGGGEIDDETILEYLKLYYPDDVPEDATSLDGISEERIETVRELVAGFNANNNWTDWMTEFRNKVGVLTYMMPEGLPYAVDLGPYEEAAYAEEQAANGDSDSGDASDSDSGSAGAEAPVSPDASLDSASSDEQEGASE